MMVSTIPSQLNFLSSYLQQTPLSTHMEVIAAAATIRPTKPRRKQSVYAYSTTTHFHSVIFKPKSCSARTVLRRVCNDDGGGGGGGAIDGRTQQEPKNFAEKSHSSSSFGDSYVGLFVRMIGLDNDLLDREQAIVALWKYSLGGKKCIDNIMQFQGCINLTVNLLKSESSSAREAAAGLLRSISSVNLYRDMVGESGAIEEITGLLSQSSLTSEIKEQNICTLWNLSVDEKLRLKIANSDVLPILIKFLEDEDAKVKEAAGGVLANLSLTHSNHNIMVEAGVIPKLAKFLKSDIQEESKVIRKEARNALVKLAKNEYYKILIIEEGLVPVPLIGAAAYKSFAPVLNLWPSLPDGTQIERTSRGPSRYGALELLLGLHVDDKNANIEEAKMQAIIGRSKQQFLARTGAIEVEDAKSSQTELSTCRKFTLLPWIDGVARLVLILELEEESAIYRAAEAIADASINELMRNAFKEAGAVKQLARLLGHKNDSIKYAVVGALEKLSVSNGICQIIEAEGVISLLVNILKNIETSESMMEKALNLLARILDPSKEMKLKFCDGPVNGFEKSSDAARLSDASIEQTAKTNEMSVSKTKFRQDVLDSALIARLVEMLKHPLPSLQRKAASVLEFIAIIDKNMDTFISVNVESGLDAVFQQKILNELGTDMEIQQTELYALQIEEAGLAISASSRFLTRLLESDQFCHKIDSARYTQLLRKILKSDIPVQYKDWVGACLVKLSSLYGSNLVHENPINMEVTFYETIPRLIEQLCSSSQESQETAAVELNRIISEGVVDATQAVASQGGIFPLVMVIKQGSERAVEAALSVMYNLSMDSENHSAIIAAGALPALRRIIQSQRPHSPQWKRALHLLRNLPT